ncbi:hypothetical protein GCM10010399_76890 [Dactylosporangium fulvum]|uniref:Uncharacterized protein n=2 Tax=Dactylosporangium fulvum TaxID=53359 RepID=A0ABY5W6B5_9ACTN|nr:hypothetical protein [Dactylosporangium fulvum]UWP84905.1 hypothetical protein Dfulv_12015 [Dactylosporangium fulvum]
MRIALACGELPDHGGDRPQVTVTIPLQVLRDGAAAGLAIPERRVQGE